MAAKVVIQELVSKYVFDVDKTGADAYKKKVKEGEDAAKAASKGATDAAKKEAREKKEAAEKAAKATEALEKRKEAAAEKASRRATARVERLNKRIEAANKRRYAAEARGDRSAASIAAGEARRAEAAKARASDRASRQRIRAEKQVERATARSAKRARMAVAWESSLAAKASAKAAALAKAAWGALKMGALVGVAAGAAAAAGSIKLVNDETARLDAIAKGAQKTGLGFDSYQRLSHIATLSGTNITALAKASLKLGLNLDDVASGGGKAAGDALAAIGLTVDDLRGKAPEAQLGVIAEAMQRVDDDAEKSRIAFDLFGKSGTELIPLLNTSVESLDELAESTGRIFTREELAKAEAYQDALANAKKAMADAAGATAVNLAPFFTKALDAAREFLPYVVDHFKRLYSAIQPALSRLWEIAKVVFERLKPAFEEFRAALLPVIDRLGGGVGGALDSLGPAIEGVISAVELFVSILSTLLKVGVSVYDWVVKFLAEMKEEWPGVFDAAAKVVSALMNPVDSVRGAVEALFDWLEKVVGKVGFLADKVREIKSALGLGKGTGGPTEGVGLFVRVAKETGIVAQDAQIPVSQPAAEPAAEQPGAFSAGLEGVEIDPRKKVGSGGKGKGDKATGLQAQIDAQFKQMAADAELRASARALREGKSPKEAFKIGKEAAKATEQRLKRRFEETGELPAGISRDIQSLASSPAVEDAIGRVPPPVISVTNNVNNVTVSGNTFETNVDARLTDGTTVRELTTEVKNATRQMVREEIGEAVANTMPRIRV